MEPKAGEQDALIAAFRQGLGLAGLAVIRRAAGIRFAATGPAGVGALPKDDAGEVRFWCRHAADAERIVTAANAKLQRQSRDAHSCVPPREASSAIALGHPDTDQTLVSIAARLHVALYANDEISSDALAVIARVETELGALQHAGELKSVNRSYREYRQNSSARGEKTLPYARWLCKYKQNLVRELAVSLRYF